MTDLKLLNILCNIYITDDEKVKTYRLTEDYTAISSWTLNVERNDCIGFALLCYLIGLENSPQSLNQSEVKTKPMVPWSQAFSRAWARVLVWTLSSQWLNIFLGPDWPLWLPWFGFYIIQSKSAVRHLHVHTILLLGSRADLIWASKHSIIMVTLLNCHTKKNYS